MLVTTRRCPSEQLSLEHRMDLRIIIARYDETLLACWCGGRCSPGSEDHYCSLRRDNLIYVLREGPAREDLRIIIARYDETRSDSVIVPSIVLWDLRIIIARYDETKTRLKRMRS